MGRRLIECVPNFSEGRDLAKVDEIAAAITATPGAYLLARESDIDHNRSVLTVAGDPEAVVKGVFEAVATASRLIDLNLHKGVHPRIGAADVVPLVPVQGITLEECVPLAHRLGERIARELEVPVYFYEAAALRPECRRLEMVRRGGLAPDLGGPGHHPTAGATVVGARKFLLAFNINLATADISIAREIARKVRASSGGLPHVKAMGVYLASRDLAQVSMNLTDFEITPLHVVFDAVREQAARFGVRIAGSEIIGLMPAKALAQVAASALQCENYQDGVILENRLLSNLID